jgi:hypothetical protein
LKRISIFMALFAVSFALSAASASAWSSQSVYNAVPKPLPPNVASLGFEATSTSEFGDYVHLGGKNRLLKTVTVTMSDWALAADYPSLPATGWTHPITVNVYSSHLGSNGVPDQLVATVTQIVTIPWRPAADPTCPFGGTAWRASDLNCYNGLAFNALFNFGSQNVTLPKDVIVGVAYNTADYGATPIHLPGPYNSLNVGVPTGQTASVGTDDNADNVFWNTSFAGFYTDGGTAGVGIFRQDTNWTPNGTVAFKITAARTKLKLDREDIDEKGCTPRSLHAKEIVDVHGKLINDYDSGFGGNAWANDTIERHLRIWKLNNGTYCSQVEDQGKFLTFAGTSPSGFSTVSAGIKGELEGGYVTTFFTGTFAPTLPVHGNVGTFNLACTPALVCPGPSLNYLRYFSATAGNDLAEWGWIYEADHGHGTWLNQDNVPAASSGDITG